MRFFQSAILLLALAAAAPAATGLKVIHAFGISQQGGSDLYGALLMDSAGNLYGTAESGGAHGAGVVYKLTRQSGGGWAESVLYSFKGGSQDGATPHDALVMDADGNLYGTTSAGGGCSRTGCGIVFELSPTAGGPWTETVLHRFAGGTADGSTPYSGVILDHAGNLYGTANSGGASNAGLAYELSPNGTSTWTETILHNFNGSPDGAAPFASLVFDTVGNLYGTTYKGGSANQGTVFELTPQAGGTWTAAVLHSFHGAADGSDLFENVILDAAGNIYGSAESGGSANCGVSFKLSPDGTGGWTETILHTFLGVGAQDGENPNALILDSAGDLYGTTVGGGVDNPGTIFKLTPQAGGEWAETVLYSFTGKNDGAYPSVPLITDKADHLYGTTLWGGPAGDTVGGLAFEFTP